MCHNVTNAPKEKIFQELRPKVKVTLMLKQCVTLGKPQKKYPHTEFGILTLNKIRDMLLT